MNKTIDAIVDRDVVSTMEKFREQPLQSSVMYPKLRPFRPAVPKKFDPYNPSISDMQRSTKERTRKFTKLWYKDILAPRVIQGAKGFDDFLVFIGDSFDFIMQEDAVEFDDVESEVHDIALNVCIALQAIGEQTVRPDREVITAVNHILGALRKAAANKKVRRGKRTIQPYEVIALAIDVNPF